MTICICALRLLFLFVLHCLVVLVFFLYIIHMMWASAAPGLVRETRNGTKNNLSAGEHYVLGCEPRSTVRRELEARLFALLFFQLTRVFMCTHNIPWWARLDNVYLWEFVYVRYDFCSCLCCTAWLFLCVLLYIIHMMCASAAPGLVRETSNGKKNNLSAGEHY